MKQILLAAATAGALAFTALGPAVAADSAADLAKMRSEHFKAASADMKAIGEALKAKKVDVADVQARAANIASNLGKATSGYKEGMAEADKSDAKKSVWAEPEKFKALADASIAAANELATFETHAKIGKGLEALGKTCKACHEVYRN